MTPEIMKFWLDMFHSPVALTLAGALLGAVSTLAGLWLKSRSDAKENQKAWERQEITRKEERLFQLKCKAYEDFVDCHSGVNFELFTGFAQKILPTCMHLVNYGSEDVRKEAYTFVKLLEKAKGQTLLEKVIAQDPQVLEALNSIHDYIIKDINRHHGQ